MLSNSGQFRPFSQQNHVYFHPESIKRLKEKSSKVNNSHNKSQSLSKQEAMMSESFNDRWDL